MNRTPAFCKMGMITPFNFAGSDKLRSIVLCAQPLAIGPSLTLGMQTGQAVRAEYANEYVSIDAPVVPPVTSAMRAYRQA